ncbi:MAG: c-type cytochrome, partial [Verrucomicrobiota bacterium]
SMGSRFIRKMVWSAIAICALSANSEDLSPGGDSIISGTPVPQLDAYESWKMAHRGEDGSSPPLTTIQAPPGFSVELVCAAESEEGSWVSLAFDDRDRLYLGVEDKGILRFHWSAKTKGGITIDRREWVDDSLEECRGLVWAHGALYANANDSKALFRLRDTTGDDQFDERKLLLATSGGVGHGRNHLRLGPDGFIYIVHGNNPWLSEGDESPRSPYRNWDEDQLIPNPWDDSWNKLPAPAGYILRTDKDGTFFERICGGLRNPLDLDFNEDGEMFVYDADSEWDAGLAWYKPTRVLHIVSGADYGWRRGTGKWPAYYADSLPSVSDIGLGSPTGVGFGYDSGFPRKWRDAFFIADWSYGRLLAVHINPDGASYSGHFETFLSGRPLNLTDFVFHDEALWFITGGRRTQSALYRVRWTGPEEPADPLNYRGIDDGTLRELRHQLEQFHVEQSPEGLRFALDHLDHPDRFIRHAARVALENQPLFEWESKVIKAPTPAGLLALARLGTPASQDDLVTSVCEMIQQGQVDDSTLLDLLRVLQVSFIRQGEPREASLVTVTDTLTRLYPALSWKANHELCELLVYLEAPGIIDRTLTMLEESSDTRDWSHYLVFLRYVEDGWTTDFRRRYLESLRRFESFPGGRWYVRTAQDLRTEAVAALTEAEKETLAHLLDPSFPAVAAPPVTVDPANFVENWQMSDFEDELNDRLGQRPLDDGRAAYHQAGCAACHRIGSDPATTNAILGPDLSAIGSRFDHRAMLESIIHPSLVIGDKYRNPAGPNVSTMPPGLLNGLEKNQILDLLHYLAAQSAP